MTVDKSLNPLRSILDGTHLFGALDASPAYFRTRLIGKGGDIGHARKIGELGRHDHLFVLAPAAFHCANRD
jgi:hypothetical protein